MAENRAVLSFHPITPKVSVRRGGCW